MSKGKKIKKEWQEKRERGQKEKYRTNREK